MKFETLSLGIIIIFFIVFFGGCFYIMFDSLNHQKLKEQVCTDNHGVYVLGGSYEGTCLFERNGSYALRYDVMYIDGEYILVGESFGWALRGECE